MNSAEHTRIDEPVEQTPAATSTETSTQITGLYPGDRGELSLQARRVLVQLLAGPSLDGRRHALLWPILIRDEEAICRRLSELFLELVIDRDQQVAFTRQVDTGELDTPLLLRRAKLSLLDSILLLQLRQVLTQADARGERAVVSRAEMIEYLGVYERANNTDRALFEKRIRASLEKVRKHSILRKIRGSDDRFEVSPTLKLLFSAEEIQALTQVYERMAEPQPASPDHPMDQPADQPVAQPLPPEAGV